MHLILRVEGGMSYRVVFMFNIPIRSNWKWVMMNAHFMTLQNSAISCCIFKRAMGFLVQYINVSSKLRCLKRIELSTKKKLSSCLLLINKSNISKELFYTKTSRGLILTTSSFNFNFTAIALRHLLIFQEVFHSLFG